MGTEAAARRARYAFLERAADALHCAVIATAHTADDQAETMLLQLCRGAGSRGLSGIPPRRGRVVRPLLAVPRRELERYARETGIPHREDPTNAGDSFARNRLRHHVLPVLETVNPAFLGNFGRCAARLAEDDACLYAQAEAFLEANPSLPADMLLALPEAVRGRVYRLAAGRSLEWAHVPILDDLCRGGNGRRVSLPEGDAAEKTQRMPPLFLCRNARGDRTGNAVSRLLGASGRPGAGRALRNLSLRRGNSQFLQHFFLFM